MRPNPATSRVLCLLLVLAALLPPTARGSMPNCGSGADEAAAIPCCCAPAAPPAPGSTSAPDCHGMPSGPALASSDCGCSAEAPPATTPPLRLPWTGHDPAHDAALPPRHVSASIAPRHAARLPESGRLRSDRSVSLLRLHCVNLI